jgi:hypothetical protein
MRKAVRFVSLSLFGIVTTVAAYAVGLVVMPATALSVDLPEVTHAAVPSAADSGTCTIQAPRRDLTARILAQHSGKHSSTGTGGDIEASVPRAVFVRVVGRDLVVTTNSGAAPRRGDTYCYVRDGHSGLAVPRVADLVRASCGGMG